MGMDRGTVLVVEYDDDERERISGVLESGGFEVLECPGPHDSDFTCIGGRNLDCALARDADVVVLDLRLASDEMMMGTPGWMLLTYYMAKGKRIVALSGSEDSVHPLPDGQVAVLRRPPDGQVLLGAVRQLA